MEIKISPNTKEGKWSVGLNAFFLASIGISVLLVNRFGLLSYGDRWWDITVAIIFPASILAFAMGLSALIKRKERSVLVDISVFVSVCVILFILLHSLFIND